MSVETTATAARDGDLVRLRRIREDEGAPWDPDTAWMAALYGRLECLAYAHEHGCPWDRHTTWCAAAAGQLDCLAYTHEHGCPWDQHTTWATALYGHLDCLAYAHENGCHWDPGTACIAAMHGRLECLAYAVEHGYPVDARDPDVRRHRDVVSSARRRRAAAVTVQRAWRERAPALRERRLAAARAIEDVYLAHACRPGSGPIYARAAEAFEESRRRGPPLLWSHSSTTSRASRGSCSSVRRSSVHHTSS